jgi:hypothetical protein
MGRRAFLLLEEMGLMKTTILMCAMLAIAISLGASAANAGCVTKGAVATAASADSAKWFALETMVQSVSWGLWPGFVATGDVAGYKVVNKRYKCSPDSGMVTCRGRATFCAK